MNMKDIENANAKKAKATRGNVYAIYKSILKETSNVFQINHEHKV